MTTNPIKPEPALDIDGLLAFHRSVFGDARMEDEGAAGGEGGSEGSGEGSGDTGEGAGGDEGQSSETGEGNKDEGKKPEDELPEWAREKMTKANNEAASYRTKLRDLEKRFEGAKTADEFEAAVNALKEENATLAREALVAKVARKFSLPDDLAELLKGDNEEALEAHATSLQKYVSSDEDPENLSGGLTPTDGSKTDEDDPRKLAETYGGRRRPV